MRNKYFILVLTFLCILVSQTSFGQDYNDLTDNSWGADGDIIGDDLDEVVVVNDYHEPDYSEYINADLYDPYNHSNDPIPVNFEEPEGDPVVNPTNPATPDPEVCTLSVCTKTGYEVNTALCACVPIPRYWYLDNDGDDYYASTMYQGEKPTGNYKETTKGDDCDDNDALKNGANCGYLNWYLDWDGDGYHSDTDQSVLSPGTGWVLTTKGVDCDENDPTKTTYCGDKMWYTDNDNDGWYANLKGSEESPGTGYIDYAAKPPKGQDCDDTKPSANNICAPIDDCAEIKKQRAIQKYKDMMAELQNPGTLTKHHETGYWQDSKGEYHQMEISGSNAVLLPKDRSTVQNFNHVHMDDWIDPVTGNVISSYPMPSNSDIYQVYNLYNNARANGLDLGNTYVGNISSLGSFQMRFIGNSDSITSAKVDLYLDFLTSPENREAYALSMSLYGDVAGLLAFIKEMGMSSNIALYQIEESGASKLELDTNNQAKKVPCN